MMTATRKVGRAPSGVFRRFHRGHCSIIRPAKHPPAEASGGPMDVPQWSAGWNLQLMGEEYQPRRIISYSRVSTAALRAALWDGGTLDPVPGDASAESQQ